MLESGLKYTSSVVVDDKNTAIAMGSGDLPVFATPSMVALMENAAMQSVANYLPEGSATVGGHIDVSHLCPSALGAKIEATATLTSVEGRKLEFTVVATDGDKVIGKGTHIRFIVDRTKFMQKLI